ncbi:hypothetical protein ACNOYE_02035 [Nannocystaceae bacterium ST9]
MNRRSRSFTTLALWSALLAPALAGGGCRCKEDTLAPIVFDDDGSNGPIDPSRVLAPPWQPPAVTQLDNGALMHWLVEPGDPAFHLRVLMPTSIHADKLGAAGTSAALQALELRLSARLRRIEDANYDLHSRAGRVEFAVHGRDRDAAALITAVAETLADAGDPKLLAVAQGKVLAKHREADASALAAAGLISVLFDYRLAHEYASKQDLVDLNRTRLERSWTLLSDPRHALVVVHAGRSAEPLAEAVELLGSKWKVGVLGSGKPNATTRLHADPPEVRPETWLFGDLPAPLQILPGTTDRRGRAVIMFGRIIPTASVEARALARISQRLLQEELDVRLVVAGPISLLAVRVHVSAADPLLEVMAAIEKMQAMAGKAQPEPRIRQAADLWLGARMVEASVSGEDWTALWSESIDLAQEDREIFAALAREAKTMLELDPEQVRAFHAQWLDPRGGEPGWVWVASGLTSAMRTKLAAKVELVDM